VIDQKSFITGKNVLVTGGCGLVGSHLVEELSKQKANVIVSGRSHSPFSYYNYQNLYQSSTWVYADLKSFKRVFDLVSRYEIEYIFHLGAQAIVDTAYYNPLETFHTNIIGTINILEAARLYNKVKAVIVASSDKAYGKSNKKYQETDPLRGDHPYEVSKSCTDLIANTYYKTYGLPVSISRFGNIYGPGDANFSRIIPGIIKALILDEKLSLRSDGTYVRDYVYVKDVVNGYLTLAENIELAKGEAFNFSSPDTLSVLELIDRTQNILKKTLTYEICKTARNEITFQSLDCSKAERVLGWKSQYSISNSLLPTFQWYYNFFFNR
jgi:CDP-glucose 4,6-dehydratase